MAVEAVLASFVREKLTEPIEKSLILKKVIDEVGKEIRIIAGEEDRLKLECDYLGILYEVEDVIETFRVARDQRRRRRSSLWPISGFYNHLRSHRSLRRKMEQIRHQIKNPNCQKPDCQARAGSISSRSAQRLQQNGDHCSIYSADDHAHECLQEEKEPNGSTDLRRLGKNSSSHHEPEFLQRPRHEHEHQQEEEKQEANGAIDLPRIGKSSSGSRHGHRRAPSLDEWLQALQLRHEDEHDECLEDKKESNSLGSVDLPRLGKNSSSHHEPEFLQRPRHEHEHEYQQEEEKQEANGSIDLPRIGKSSSGSRHGHRRAPSLDEWLQALQLRHEDEHDKCLEDMKESNSLGSVDLPILRKTSSSNHGLAISQGSDYDYDVGLTPASTIGRIKSHPSFNDFVLRLQRIKSDPSFLEWTLSLWRWQRQQLQETPRFNLNWENLYNDRSFHSKLCLLYLTLFPKKYDIPVRRLLGLWLAEGFVKRSTSKIPEDVAQEYFEHLVKTNMIHITKFRSDGSARRCRLQGDLYDKLLSKAQAISLFHIHRSTCNCAAHDPSSTSFVVRRIVEYVEDIKNCNPPQLHSLRSYLSFNTQEKDTPAREVGQFLSRIIENKQGSGFGLLRVLDLEGVYKPSLPKNLGDLFNLRYLGLRWTFLDHLPSSVGDLPYLETLDLKHTNINNLPNSIWKLKQLRHLNLNEIRLNMPPHSFRLLTLWGLFVDDKSPVMNGLNKLHDLRELGVTFHLSSSGQDIADWVEKLTGLQSLRLRSRDERGCPLKLYLKPLSGLKNLSHLYLLGNLQKLPEQNEFPPAVKVLTLSVSRLEKDPMPILGQLPNLTVLRLLGDSYLGTEFRCPGFSKLQVLKLWMLKKLEKWDVEEGAMQNLKEVNIRCCHELKNIPQTLLQSGTLEELVLTNMPDKFIQQLQVHSFAVGKRYSIEESINDMTDHCWRC